MAKYKIVPADFYLQRTEVVAKQLLGKILCRKIRGINYYFRIVETEAYLGLKDPSAHSFHGKITNRTKTMYAEGGKIYIYLIYGIHLCLNIVTREAGIPEAVLIRALEPISDPKFKTKGPGLIGHSLKLSLNMNGLSVFDPNSSLQILEQKDFKYNKSEIVETTRIGIERHTEAKTWPLRFYVKSSEFVSKKSV